MNKRDKAKLKQILDDKVKEYFDFFNRDDCPDRPCVHRAVATAQNTVFNFAEMMWHIGVITWEECCEYWAKVGIVDGCNEKCKFTECGANIDGVCKYTIKEG